MGNQIVTEADRKRTPAAPNTEGYIRPQGTGQRRSLERGKGTHKKNPGKRSHKGG